MHIRDRIKSIVTTIVVVALGFTGAGAAQSMTSPKAGGCGCMECEWSEWKQEWGCFYEEGMGCNLFSAHNCAEYLCAEITSCS